MMEVSSMVCTLDLFGSREGNTLESTVVTDAAHTKKIIHLLIECGELLYEE